MTLFQPQTAAQMAASEDSLYQRKFTYGLAIAGGIGTLVYAVNKNKKNKAIYAIGGLVIGIAAGYALDMIVNKEQAPASVGTTTTTATPTASAAITPVS